MTPQVRRAKLSATWWWIVHRKYGRLTVILDEAVPAGSASEQLLIALAMQDWREHHRRHGIGVFPASTVAAAAVVLLVVAASAVYVLTGDGVFSGPADSWAEGAAPPSSSAPPARPRVRTPGPGRSVAAGPGAPRMVPSKTVAPVPSPALTMPETTPEPVLSVSPSPRQAVRRPVRVVRKTVRPRLPVKVRPRARPCELLGLPVGHCR